MKLFVWNEPYNVKYGQSMCFAVAETLEDAIVQLGKGKSYSYFSDKEDRSRAVAIEVGPSRIVDLPCAEWHEWSE